MTRASVSYWLLAIGCWLLPNGCGYTHSAQLGTDAAGGYTWQSLYRQDVRTVAVPIFANRDFHRGVEFKLTRALVQQIEANTPYKVVDRDRADTILEGEVIAVRSAPLSTSKHTALPQEQLMTVTINFLWKDLRNGRILVQRRRFDQSAAYYPSLGEGEFVGTEQSMEKLALGIVQELQAAW